MKLWIDDLRPAPDDWAQAYTSTEAIDMLAKYGSEVEEVSFDHDLGGDDTSRKVIMWICENGFLFPPVCRVHTANSVGRDWLAGMIDRYGPGVTR